MTALFIHPYHKGAAEYLRSQNVAPDDVVLAEDVLQQTYYLGSVDYWLISRRIARRYVERVDGRIRDFYTGTPVISSSQMLTDLLDLDPCRPVCSLRSRPGEQLAARADRRTPGRLGHPRWSEGSQPSFARLDRLRLRAAAKSVAVGLEFDACSLLRDPQRRRPGPVLSCAQPIQTVEQRARLGIGQDSIIVGTVGRLAPEKNQIPLLDALAEVRAAGTDAHLLIVGDGAMRQALEERAAALGVSRHVTFDGAQTDVRPLLGMMDVFVLPSPFIERFSNAALEAMAMRVPVILTRPGGAAEMINDGEEGFLLDAEELSGRLPVLLQTLARDQEFRRRMGAAALRRVQHDFSWSAMVEGYADLFAPKQGARHA